MSSDEQKTQQAEQIASLRRLQIDKIAKSLSEMQEPHLESVSLNLRGKETRENSPKVENLGYFDIKIDYKALEEILRACNVSEDAIAGLSISVRAATFANRNFVGGVIGGMTNGEEIEVYSSLLANINSMNVKETFRENHLIHVPFNKDAFIKSLLHEVRHFIQVKTGIFTELPDTYHVSSDVEYYEDPAEIDAIAFEDLYEAFDRFVEIKPFEDFLVRYEDAPNNSRLSVDSLAGLNAYLNTEGKVAHTIQKDHVGGILLTFIEHNVETGRIHDPEEMFKLIERISNAVTMKKIGHVEQKYLLQLVLYQAKEVGNMEIEAFLSTWMDERK